MDTSAMVGLMGLTFFCNKCVEVFYKFRCGKVTSDSDELKQTCERAINAFKSLKWPREPDAPSAAERAIFNTNEEIESLEQVMASETEEANETLDTLIEDLQDVLQGTSLAERNRKAEKLQKFFDTLGDYSFYAARDSLRRSESVAGV